MFAVTLNTATPPAVVGYEVMNQAMFVRRFTGVANKIFITPADLGGLSVLRFIQQFNAFTYDAPSKTLVLTVGK